MKDLRRQDGFTLLELLVAVTIMVIVTSQLFMVFSSQKRTFHANQRALDVQEDARLVLDLIAFDARQAGFMVPRIAGVSSEDGGNAGPDRLCVSDPGYFPYPVTGTASVLDTRSAHLTTTTAINVSDGDNKLDVTTLDIDGSQAYDGTSPVDFVQGSGVIVSDGARTVCATITGLSGNELELDRVVAGLTEASTRVAPAIIYQVADSDGDGRFDTLTRNGMTLATSVEDLQVEFWVDNRTPNGLIDGPPTGDPLTEFPIHDLNTSPGWAIDTSRIRRVRVSVMTVTNMREVNPDGTEKITATAGRPALANRAAGAPDGRQRRRFVASVMPKNLM
jgi:prepilin-type N-terminal cleavage/methylation domain-containing protein